MSAEEEDNTIDTVETSPSNGKTKEKEPNTQKWKKNSKKIKNTRRKRTSKLSTTIEKGLCPEFFDKDKDKDDVHNQSASSDTEVEVFTMLSLTVNLVMKEVIKPVSILLSNNNKVEALIIRALTVFNEAFAFESTKFRLVTDHTQYGLKPSKKTGFPKSEMPSFNPKATIAETNCLQFTLIWKENSSDYSSYFIETKAKSKMICKDCMIY